MKRSLFAVPAIVIGLAGGLTLGACSDDRSESLDRIASNTAPSTGFLADAYADAPGGTAENAYISALDSEDIDYSSEANAITAGRSICDLLDSGYDLIDTVLFFSENSGYSTGDSGYIVGAASAAFCPENI